MSIYTKATPEGEVPMTPDEVAYWNSVLAEEAAKQALRDVTNPDATIPTTTP